MEMERPKEHDASNAPPAFATPPPQLSSVEDLQRRLRMIGNESPDAAPAAVPAVASKRAAIPSASATATATTTAAHAPVKGGKTALLARIMAAKEKSQKTQVDQKQPSSAMKPPPEVDLLGDFDAPGKESDPPPAYDTNFFPAPPPPTEHSFMPPPPPHEEATDSPPPFDDSMAFLPPPPLNTLAPPPSASSQPTYAMPPPPAASAPDFEDLMSHQHSNQPPPPPMDAANLLDMPEPMSPPPEIDEDILAALDPAEREAILEEQRKIMAQIEKEKEQNNASGAAARALAFDQRSSAAVAKVAGQYDSAPTTRQRSSATASGSRSKKSSSEGSSSTGLVNLGNGKQVPLHGQEQTQKAIKDGTAMIVQCLNCQNWMQVTKDATLMFCPTCQVVSPVLADEAATDKDLEAAAQMAADAQLAEKLQAEEYGRATATRSGAESAKSSKPKTEKLEKGQAMEQSWYDWFMGSSTTQSEPATPSRGSAELPSRGTAGGSGGLVAASTGEEVYGRNRGYDESERLMGGGGARMAESKGMFACVADAVGSAVYAMNQDEEGNVHGVDSSGLLAMPNVSRQRDS